MKYEFVIKKTRIYISQLSSFIKKKYVNMIKIFIIKY